MRERIWQLGCYSTAVFLAASAVWATVGGTNISVQNGQIAVTGPLTPTSYTANGVLLGNGSSAIAVTNACTTANQTLLSGSPPTCGALTTAYLPSGATLDSEINTIAGLNTMVGDADIMTIDTSQTVTGAKTWNALIDIQGGILEAPNSTTPVAADCDAAGEAGRLYVKNDGLTGQKLKVCSGAGGWENVDAGTAVLPVLMFSTDMDISANNTVYINPGAVDATESRAEIIMPAATIKNLRCRQAVAAGAGANHDVVITAQAGTCGSAPDATLTCTITGGASAASCSDTTNTATTAANDCFSLKVVVQSAVSAAQLISCSAERTS